MEIFGYPSPWRQWINDIITIGILKEGIGLNEVMTKINNNVNEYNRLKSKKHS